MNRPAPRRASARVCLELCPLESRDVPSAVQDRGQPSQVLLLDTAGSVRQTVQAAAPSFTGGLWVATGDVTGDTVPDLVSAAGPGGGPQVNVYDGNTGQVVRSFMAYDPAFTGGIYAVTADFNGDGKAEIVTGTDQGGGPRVRVLDGETPLVDFLGINDVNFRGGVRVAAGDVNADDIPDLVVSAGFQGGPRIAGYDGAAIARGQVVPLFNDFFAFEPALRNGAYPAVGDLDGDGYGELIFGAGPDGGPRVLAYDGKAALGGRHVVVLDFLAGNLNDRDGVRVAAIGAGDGKADVLTASGTGGAALIYDGQGGGLIRGVPREIAFNAGLFDDATGRDLLALLRTVPDPTVDPITAVVRGTYTGIVTQAVSGFPPSMGNFVQLVDHHITVVIDRAELRSHTLDQLRQGGRQVGLVGRITVSVPGVFEFTKPLSGGLTSDPFTQFPQSGSGFLAGGDGAFPPPGALNQWMTLGVMGQELRWTPAGFTGDHLSYVYVYARDSLGGTKSYTTTKSTADAPYTLTKQS